MLAAAARALGYPIVLFRLCLMAYRFPRTIGIDGNYSRTLVATRGITAGSGSATSELRVLLFGMMNELNERWSRQLTVKLYVDDLHNSDRAEMFSIEGGLERLAWFCWDSKPFHGP